MANWPIVKDEEESMRWKRDWAERKLRLKVKSLSKERKDEISFIPVSGIGSSSILSSLNIRVRAFRTCFFIEQLWNDNLNRKLEAKVNVTGLC